MKKIIFLFFLISFSALSQEAEYDTAKKYLKDNQLEEATLQIQKAIKKTKTNKSKYYLLYASILKNKDIADSSLYYYNVVERDYIKRKISDSLLLTIASKVEFYRFNNKKVDADFNIKKINQFQFNQIYNKDIVAYALNRKLAIFNQYHYNNKDTIKLIDNIGIQILDLEKQIKNKEVIAYTLNEIAQIEDYRGDKNKAFAKYETALKYAEQHQLLNPQIDISFNLATLYSRFKKDNKTALQILEKLVPKVEEGSNIRQKFYLFLKIKDYYRFTNRLEEAYLAFDKAYQYSQELNDQQSYFKLTALERKFELEKKEKQIQENENKIKIQNLEIENSSKKFWLILIIFLLTIIGIITLTYFFRREKKSNKQLSLLSDENEFLLSEAHHRINNNLQLIIILINEELKKATSENNVQIKKILTKVDSIASLHRHLYNSTDKRMIELDTYLKDLQVNFYETFTDNNIINKFNIQKTYVSVDMAMYLGLLFTELSINSLKYAFKNQEYKETSIQVSVENNQLYFNYSDNGIGFKNDIKLKLIDKLCRQLKVEYTIEANNGFHFSFVKNI
ncbi:sensor histidine kinase [Flavobacterium sp.]|jgi:two-component sensor histidine kinase|uniref:tetratricopeptide repeat-containing sensor histidine kinase n=1 Tax=Flavobacterium sp. TaxID=239 RepID=UPI002A8055BC|nr:sensor histidine kinase [Flavobacterium sp.]